jgi:hypothetical protein
MQANDLNEVEKPLENTGALFGLRKFFLCLIALVLLFVGVITGHIPGETGAWAIVAVISLVITGYAGEYFLNKKKV